MSDCSKTNTPTDRDDLQDRIDLLVECELSANERQTLIHDLDRDPARWRQCALAFIERDVLRQSLIQLTETADPPSCKLLTQWPASNDADMLDRKPVPGTAATASSHRRSSAIWICASLLCLALGFVFGSVRNTTRDLNSMPIAERWSPSAAAPQALDPMSSPIAVSDPDLWLQVTNAVDQLSVADSRIVALVEFAPKNAAVELLPIIQSATLTRQIANLPKPTLPPSYVDQIQQAGWQFDTAHQFLSVHTPDGQNQVMPVSMLNYRYVGNKVF